ncbi:MAG: transporter substrate-binding domain-containing protein [Bacteroidales bacterium]
MAQIKINKRLLLYLFLLLLTIGAMVGIRLWMNDTPNHAPRDLKEIREEGILRIAIEYNTSSYYVSGDTIAGMEYELCRTIEKKSGLKVEIYPEMNLQNSLDGLQQRRVDIVAKSIPITSELKESFHFTEPITTNRLVLVQRTAVANDGIDPIRNQLELAGKTVYIPEESGAKYRIANLSEEIADSIYLKEDPLYGEEQLIILVAHKEIDYAICDERIARKFTTEFPQIDILTAVSFNQFRGWALRKESAELLDSVNVWLKEK